MLCKAEFFQRIPLFYVLLSVRGWPVATRNQTEATAAPSAVPSKEPSPSFEADFEFLSNSFDSKVSDLTDHNEYDDYIHLRSTEPQNIAPEATENVDSKIPTMPTSESNPKVDEEDYEFDFDGFYNYAQNEATDAVVSLPSDDGFDSIEFGKPAAARSSPISIPRIALI